jgi:uncharacterized membrane protein YcgQ (UPF0703/DUF1980 family)
VSFAGGSAPRTFTRAMTTAAAARPVQGAGIRVDIDGLVSGELEEGTFEFSRFFASCCAADAMPFSIRVQPPADAPELELSQWLQVAGTLQSIGGSLVVLAERMERIDRPADPYGL